MLRRLRRLIPLVALLAWPASSALAASAVTDRDYRGVLVERANGHVFNFPITFHVSKDGRTAGPIHLPDGIPVSAQCAMGPLGTPYEGLAHIANGRFAITEDLHLPAPNDHGLGHVVISGSFGPHGSFAGRFANRTSAEICQTTLRFSAQAVPKPKPPVRSKRSDRSCSDTRENQWKTVAFRFRELHQTVRQGQPAGVPPLIDDLEPPRERTFATIRIGAATCRSPHGWRVISPINVRPYSEGLRNDPDDPAEPRGSGSVKGWGIAVERIRSGVMQVRAMACRQGRLWSAVQRLEGFPLPVPYVVSLTQFAVTQIVHLPHDGVRCADLGTDHLVIRSDGRGRLRVSEFDPALGAVVEESRPQPDFLTRYSRIVNQVAVGDGR